MRAISIFTLIFVLLSFGRIMAATPSQTCDTATPADHWYSETLGTFVNAGGCAVMGPSLNSSAIMAPYFVVTKLNSESIASGSGLSIFDLNSKARTLLETIYGRKDIQIIIAPMTDNSGLVVTMDTDPQLFKLFRLKFAHLPNINDIKILFVLGDKATPVTAFHEAHHVKEIDNGRLPIPESLKVEFAQKIDQAIARFSIQGGDERIRTVIEWFQAASRLSPEIPAVRAEFDFTTGAHAPENAASFLDYLRASNHDFINKYGGMQWLNQEIKEKTLQDPFLADSAAAVCTYLRLSLKNSNVEALFANMFPSCH